MTAKKRNASQRKRATREEVDDTWELPEETKRKAPPKTSSKPHRPRLPKPRAWYAEHYGVDVRTITNWRTAGVDVTDEKAVAEWRAAKDQGRKDGGEKAAHVTFPKVDASEIEGGAAAALSRLEEAEKQAFEHFTWAMGEGNAQTIKLAREGWLKLGDALRRYDLQVAESRRESGALLAREEVERILSVVAWFMRIAGREVIIASAKNLAGITKPELIAHECEDLLGEQLMISLAALLDTAEGGLNVPAWVREALSSDLDTFFREAQTQLDARAEAIKQAVRAITKKKKGKRK